MIIKGQHLRIFLNNGILAMSTSCNVRISNVLKETTNKDSVGDFVEQEVLAQNWSITAECVIDDSVNYGYTPADLKGMVGTKFQLDFAYASGTHNADKGDMLVTGFAILSDVEITAQNRQKGTCNIQLMGTGWLRVPRLLADVNGVVFITSNGRALAV